MNCPFVLEFIIPAAAQPWINVYKAYKRNCKTIYYLNCYLFGKVKDTDAPNELAEKFSPVSSLYFTEV